MAKGSTLAVWKPQTQTMTGPPELLASGLRDLSHRGLLVTDPETIVPHWLPDGRASVTVRVMVRKQAPVKIGRRISWWKIAAAVVVLAILGGIGWLILQVFLAIASAVGAVSTATWGIGILVLIIAWATRSAKSGHACSGIHCSGCRR